MSKYDSLENHLRNSGQVTVPMRFPEIEKILGQKLPNSARKHRPWWSNNPGNNVMTRAWLAAGYKTENVDIGTERVVFRRFRIGGPNPSAVRNAGETKPMSIVGFLRGMVTVAPGFDTVQSTGENWDADKQ